MLLTCGSWIIGCRRRPRTDEMEPSASSRRRPAARLAACWQLLPGNPTISLRQRWQTPSWIITGVLFALILDIIRGSNIDSNLSKVICIHGGVSRCARSAAFATPDRRDGLCTFNRH